MQFQVLHYDYSGRTATVRKVDGKRVRNLIRRSAFQIVRLCFYTRIFFIIFIIGVRTCFRQKCPDRFGLGVASNCCFGPIEQNASLTKKRGKNSKHTVPSVCDRSTVVYTCRLRYRYALYVSRDQVFNSFERLSDDAPRNFIRPRRRNKGI